MTPATFYKKYSGTEINSNCLRDIACPDCGNRHHFFVVASSVFEMHDDGASEFGDLEYGPLSPASCPQCGHSGSLSMFTVRGLDNYVCKKLKAKCNPSS